MNYSKEVVHFVRLLNALHSSSPSSNPLDLIELIQRSPISSSSSSSSSMSKGQSVAGGSMGTDLLYGHHLEPTTLHGIHLLSPEDLNGTGTSSSSSNGFGNGGSTTSTDLNSALFNHSMMQIFWTVMFSTMLSLACLGNIVVIWIVLAHRRMRTVTNYFLLNLAIADLMMASLNGAPNSVFMLLHDWIFGNILCIVNNFVANFTVASCVFTMTAISMDRYMAIVRPLHPRMSKGSAWRAIVAIWVCSAILALPTLLYSTTQTYMDGSTQCFLQWPDGNPNESQIDFGYTICLLVLTYVIPMIAMAVCYGSMSKELWGHRQIGEVTERQINAMISKRKVVRMFIVIVFLFAILWAPYHLYFIYQYYDNNVIYKQWARSLYLSFYFLAMSTSMVNPIIYYLMNTRFRSYIQQVVRNFFFCHHHRRASQRRRDLIGGETPPLFRRYSQSFSRSRSGTGDDHIHQSPHANQGKLRGGGANGGGGTLVLQNQLHYYNHPMMNHAQVTMTAGRQQIKRPKGPYATSAAGLAHQQRHHHHQQQQQATRALKTCSTYC